VAPFEQGEIGAELFRAACDMGLEGMVSKRRDRAYHAGRCGHWIVSVKLIPFRANNFTA
jgi:bifunctional non-homologous end joining protein LigD